VFKTSLRLCNMVMDRFPHTVQGAIDSSATDHFMPATYSGTNHTPVRQGIRVSCANGSYMEAVATDALALPQLPQQARACHKFNDIRIPLISVPKLCEAGCTVDFQQNTVCTMCIGIRCFASCCVSFAVGIGSSLLDVRLVHTNH